MCLIFAHKNPKATNVTLVTDDDSTYSRLSKAMDLAPPSLTVDQVSERKGLSPSWVKQYWRALGFADVADDEVVFTDEDADLMFSMYELVETGAVSKEAALSLVRAQGHGMDRLVLWQVEALVADAINKHGIDDTSARLVVLDRFQDLYEDLADQLIYTWRRQLGALLGRIDRELAVSRHSVPSVDVLPLARAIGFIDMVNFTGKVRNMSPDELRELIGAFETQARGVVAKYGARVVKTVGDAVLFVADDLPTGARVALEIVEVMGEFEILMRGSVVWGRVLSRSGDVFGPTVNLASRLGDEAAPGEILTDADSADLLKDEPFELQPIGPMTVQSLGIIHPVRLLTRN